MLWDMVICGLIRKLNEEGFDTEGFADLLILLIGPCELTLCSLMQTILAIVEKWCIENGLSVNPRKTNFHKQKKTKENDPTFQFWEKAQTLR